MLACDIGCMAEVFDISVLRRNLARIMDKKGVRPTTLSLRLGSSPTMVKDLLEKTSDTKLSTIYRIANELELPVEDLISDDFEAIPVGPKLFVKGDVAAGQWREAFEWPVDDWQTLTGRADVTAERQHRFFLKVCGDSMNVVYPEGTFIECVSLFGHAEAHPGKKVVVLRRRVDNLVEATVKELVEIDGQIWLAPRSTNPSHQAFRVDEPEEGIEEVRIIAVVVASMRPE